MIQRADVNWVERIRHGSTLLFWAVFIGDLGPNAVGLALPFVSGGLSHLKWCGVIHAAAGIPALIGVLALTTAAPTQEGNLHQNPMRTGLRIFATLEVIGRLARSTSRLTLDITSTGYFAVPLRVIGVLSLLVGLLYLRRLSQCFGLAKLARSLAVFLWVYVAVSVVADVVARAIIKETNLISSLLLLVPGIAVWVWGLVLLRRFGNSLTLIAAGNCAHCGYSLRGLPEARCPECGRPFVVVTGGVTPLG